MQLVLCTHVTAFQFRISIIPELALQPSCSPCRHTVSSKKSYNATTDECPSNSTQVNPRGIEQPVRLFLSSHPPLPLSKSQFTNYSYLADRSCTIGIALYRALLQHVKNIELPKDLPSQGNINPIKHVVRKEFRRYQYHESSRILVEVLKRGYVVCCPPPPPITLYRTRGWHGRGLRR